MLKIEKTNRGFDIVKFKDRYGEDCELQKSSIATEDCIWLGIHSVKPKIMASVADQHGVFTNETAGWVDYPVPDAVLLNASMHLTRKQVKALIPLLQKFVDTGELE